MIPPPRWPASRHIVLYAFILFAYLVVARYRRFVKFHVVTGYCYGPTYQAFKTGR